MAHSGDDFGRAADAMSAADLARIYPARRVMDPGTEPMSRRGFTGSPAASPHAKEVPDRGDGLTDTAAQLLHMNRAPAAAYGEGDDGSAVREAPPMSGAANAPDDDTA
jgi:hypothetical protein